MPRLDPPAAAAAQRALLLLVRGDGAECLLGDLEEEYRRRAAAAGARAAVRWYRWQALRAICSWWHPASRLARWRLRRRRTGAAGPMERATARAWVAAGGSAAVVALGLATAALSMRAPREARQAATAGLDPAPLVFVHAVDRRGERYQQFTFPEVTALQGTPVLTQLAGYSLADRWIVRRGMTPSAVRVARVSEGFFDALHAPAYLGRLIDRDELREGADVALLGYGLWSRVFGRDSSVIGRTITIRDVPVTVVGVMAEGFEFPVGADLWRPASAWLRQDTDREVSVVALLAANVTLEEASAQVAELVSGMDAARYSRAGVLSAWVELAPGDVRGRVRPFTEVAILSGRSGWRPGR